MQAHDENAVLLEAEDRVTGSSKEAAAASELDAGVLQTDSSYALHKDKAERGAPVSLRSDGTYLPDWLTADLVRGVGLGLAALILGGLVYGWIFISRQSMSGATAYMSFEESQQAEMSHRSGILATIAVILFTQGTFFLQVCIGELYVDFLCGFMPSWLQHGRYSSASAPLLSVRGPSVGGDLVLTHLRHK